MAQLPFTAMRVILVPLSTAMDSLEVLGRAYIFVASVVTTGTLS